MGNHTIEIAILSIIIVAVFIGREWWKRRNADPGTGKDFPAPNNDPDNDR